MNLWILAEIAIIPRLQNQIVRALCDYPIEWCPSPKTLLMIYERTSSGSPLRKIAIKAYVLRSPANKFQMMTTELPEAIKFDIAICLKLSLDSRRDCHGTRILPREFYVPEGGGL